VTDTRRSEAAVALLQMVYDGLPRDADDDLYEVADGIFNNLWACGVRPPDLPQLPVWTPEQKLIATMPVEMLPAAELDRSVGGGRD
jgi:hypothetical protein